MAVPYNFGIYPTSPSTLRLIWDSPDVNEDDIIYYVHVIELEEDPVEEDFCSNSNYTLLFTLIFLHIPSYTSMYLFVY